MRASTSSLFRNISC